MELSPIERHFIQTLQNGDNALLYGVGGVGKTTVIKKIYEYFRIHHLSKRVFLTATTGVAALGLSDSEREIPSYTFHRWAGIGLAKGSFEQVIAHVHKNREALDRWKSTDILVIDEISMFGMNLWNLMDEIARTLRQNQLPFGGIQVVACGDFLQLPPVKDRWIFKSKVWRNMQFVPIVLTEPKRYENKEWFYLLGRIRRNELRDGDEEFLNSCFVKFIKAGCQVELENGIKPTILMSRRQSVLNYNYSELQKLPTEGVVFAAEDILIPKTKKRISKEYYVKVVDQSIEPEITLKIGAQVMLRRNLPDTSLVNGSRGVITDLTPVNAKVQFVSGEHVNIGFLDWTQDDDAATFTRRQIPLSLAWATTIHSSQGRTLDCVQVDMGKTIFVEAQAYVALSRVRDPEYLYLSDFDIKSVKADKEALKYDSQILTYSHNHPIKDEPLHPEVVKDVRIPTYWKTCRVTEKKVIKYNVTRKMKDKIQELLRTTCKTHSVGKGNDVVGGQRKKPFTVVKVERIENTIVWMRYSQAREEVHLLRNDTREDLKPLSALTDRPWMDTESRVNEKYLFHGPNKKFINHIIKQGFDERVSNLGIFGCGIYFAQNSDKSDQYIVECGKGKECKMFLSRVIMGKPYITAGALDGRRPPIFENTDGSNPEDIPDSVLGDTGGIIQRHKEFIVYDRSRCYPEFLITYTRT